MLVSSAMDSFYIFKYMILRKDSSDAKGDPDRKKVENLGEMLADHLNE